MTAVYLHIAYGKIHNGRQRWKSDLFTEDDPFSLTFMLADDTEPNGRVDLDLGRRNQNGMVTGVDTA